MSIRYRSRSRGVLALILVLAMLPLTACGGEDGGAEAGPSDGGGPNSESSDDSSGPVNSGGQIETDSGDFPIPAPDGLMLDALADAGIPMESQRQLYYADDDFERVVAFYDDWTSANGEWVRGESEGTVVFQSADAGSLRMITITPDHDPGAQANGPVTFVLLVASG